MEPSRRLLLVVGRFPWPARRGDQVRTVQVAGLLARRHRVTLLAPEPGEGRGEAVPADLPFRVRTYRVSRVAGAVGVGRAALRGLPLQGGLFHQPDLSRRLRELAPDADLALLQLVRLAAHAGDLGDTPFVVDLIDSLALNFARRARFDAPWRRPLLALEGRSLLRAERRLVSRAAAGLLVCERDRAWLAARLPPQVAPRLRVVPLQVAPRPVEGEGSGEGSLAPRLAFTGNLGYFPSVDAARWWVGEVWPALLRQRPELRLVLAGARPAPAVRRAARRPGVELLDSPPDLAPVLASAALALAPLRAGSGVPVKVLEAWAAGVPVVASRWAALGAGGRPGRDLLVAETAEEWREAVLRILDDPALARRLAAAGRSRLAAGHSPAAVAEALEAAIGSALDG